MNIIKLNNISVDNIQSVVKMIKSKTSLDLSCTRDFLTFDGILSQVSRVEQKLRVVSSDEIIASLSKEDLKIAAEMFLYLNFCPNLWFRLWSSFYRDLFLTQSADQIILTLNRMMKTMETHNNEDGSIMVKKLQTKIASKLSLRNTKGHHRLEISANCKASH